jgi:hypothetical protein
MASSGDVWIPLVDEPIGTIVADILRDDAEVQRLVGGPRRLLAFKTFAYIRVGVLLGQLLVETDAVPQNESETWIDALMRDPVNVARVRAEVVAVAREVAEGAAEDDDPGAPEESARARFREFARRRLESS